MKASCFTCGTEKKSNSEPPSILKWRIEGDDKATHQTPIVQPLDTLNDLLAWDPSFPSQQIELCAGKAPLAKERDGGLDASRPRMLACHDLKGGYVSQASRAHR